MSATRFTHARCMTIPATTADDTTEICTPVFLLSTSSGRVPHLTNDMLDCLRKDSDPGQPLCLSMDAGDGLSLANQQTAPANFAKLLNLPSSCKVLMCTQRGALNAPLLQQEPAQVDGQKVGKGGGAGKSGKRGENAVVVYTNKGHQRVDLNTVNEVVARVDAKFFIPPYEDSSPYEGNNRVQRAADYVAGLTETHANAATPATPADDNEKESHQDDKSITAVNDSKQHQPQRLKKRLAGALVDGGDSKLCGVLIGGKKTVRRTAHAKRICDIAPMVLGAVALGDICMGEPVVCVENKIEETDKSFVADRATMVRASLSGTPEGLMRFAFARSSGPWELIDLVGQGVDAIESVYPLMLTSLGQASCYWIDAGDNSQTELQSKTPLVTTLNLRSAEYERDGRPLVEGCMCFACRHHTRSYVHHLINTHEMLAEILLFHHNTSHMLSLFKSMRRHIKQNTFHEFATQFGKRHMCVE